MLQRCIHAQAMLTCCCRRSNDMSSVLAQWQRGCRHAGRTLRQCVLTCELYVISTQITLSSNSHFSHASSPQPLALRHSRCMCHRQRLNAKHYESCKPCAAEQCPELIL